MHNPVDVDDEEDGRVGPTTSPLPPGVAKACTTTELRRLLGHGAEAMTKRKAAAASIEGPPPGVISDRKRRFPLLLHVAPAADDIIHIVDERCSLSLLSMIVDCGVGWIIDTNNKRRSFSLQVADKNNNPIDFLATLFVDLRRRAGGFKSHSVTVGYLQV
jgi:hypothetical protein